MKIGRKLMISNIIITVLAMLILTFIISSIVKNYIENSIKVDLVKDNYTVVEWLSNYSDKLIKISGDEIYVSLEYIKVNQNFPILIAIFNMNEEPSLVSTSSNYFKKSIPDEAMKNIYSRDIKQVYDTEILDKSFLAYNELVNIRLNGKDVTLLITTLISNNNVKEIVNRIIYALIAVVAVISIIIVLINKFLQRMITRPINVLVKTVEDFSEKRFNKKAHLDTGDEFETLAIAMNNMADSLYKNDIEQKKFYENISHELKTPLTVISGYAQGIKTNIIDDHVRALDIITDECTRLKKQLENIIYMSKLETVRESFIFEKISVTQVITYALNKLDSLIIMGDIDVYFEPKSDFDIEGDEEKLKKVFINILSNCIKYTRDSIYVTVESIDNNIKIMISDNGEGFSEALLANPFDGLIVGEKEGSGIGLSIVRKVIYGHNGNIVLENKSEGGALFIIELPNKQI